MGERRKMMIIMTGDIHMVTSRHREITALELIVIDVAAMQNWG